MGQAVDFRTLEVAEKDAYEDLAAATLARRAVAAQNSNRPPPITDKRMGSPSKYSHRLCRRSQQPCAPAWPRQSSPRSRVDVGVDSLTFARRLARMRNVNNGVGNSKRARYSAPCACDVRRHAGIASSLGPA